MKSAEKKYMKKLNSFQLNIHDTFSSLIPFGFHPDGDLEGEELCCVISVGCALYHGDLLELAESQDRGIV